MATYTVSSGALVCTGTNITSAGILSALNSNGLGSGHFGQITGPKNTYYFKAPIQIGNSSSSGSESVWNCSNEIIKINASSFRIYGTVQMGSYPSSISTGGGSFVVVSTPTDAFRLYNDGIFRAYGSFVYAQSRIRAGNDTEFTLIDCDAELEDGVSVGEVGSDYGARQQITYDRTRVHHTGAVGIKLYSFNSGANAASYSLNGTRVEKCTYAFQLANAANLSPILKDVQIDTCTHHIVPNLGSANITFINPDFTVLRASGANGSDITTIAFRYNFKVQDASNAVIQNAKVYIVDQNSDVVVNAESTDANGLINPHLFNYDGDICLQNSTFRGATKTNRASHVRSAYKYGFLPKNDTFTIDQDTKDFVALLLNLNITETNKVAVDAYTEIDTSAKFYDIASSYLEDNFGTFTNLLVNRSGNLIDCRALNVDVDATAAQAFNLSGNTLTIKASDFPDDMTTTGVITLSNGATFSGTRTDANGTVLPPRNVSVTGLVAGSTIRVYNTTTSTQVVNQAVAGTSYTATYAEGVGYSVGDVLEIRVAKIDKLEFSTSVVVTATGWNSLVSQDANPTYVAYGKDGSTIAGISWDSGNVEFDFNDSDNQLDGADIGAWYYYFITTSTGIAEAFGALTWPQINRISNVTSKVAITFDNAKSAPLRINDCWIDRDDGVSIIAAGSNSIQINPPAVFIKETGVSGLTPAESAKLDVISDVDSNTKLIPALL